MSRPMLPRALLLACVLVLAVLPATALGGKPVARFHDRFTESFSTDLCGIPVDAVVRGTDNFFLYADDSFKDTSSIIATFTNPENGKSVVISNAGQVSGPAPIVDEDAGTITFITSSRAYPRRSGRATAPSCSATPASSSSQTPSTWTRATSSRPRSRSKRARIRRPRATSRSSAK